MDRALGETRRSRTVQPEACIVTGSIGGCQFGRFLHDPIAEMDGSGGRFAYYDYVLEPFQICADWLDARIYRLAHNQRDGAGIVQEVLVICRLERGIGGDWHGPHSDCAKEAGDELG